MEVFIDGSQVNQGFAIFVLVLVASGKCELLVGVISDILDLFLDLEGVGIDELLKYETLLIVRDLVASKLYFQSGFNSFIFNTTVVNLTRIGGQDYARC